jgi:hypothetical protein
MASTYAGVLFTRINLDTFDEVLLGASADLEDLLGRPPVAQGGNGEARRSDAVLMQLAVMAIFVAWNINWSPPGHTPGCTRVRAYVQPYRWQSYLTGSCIQMLNMRQVQ